MTISQEKFTYLLRVLSILDQETELTHDDVVRFGLCLTTLKLGIEEQNLQMIHKNTFCTDAEMNGKVMNVLKMRHPIEYETAGLLFNEETLLH